MSNRLPRPHFLLCLSFLAACVSDDPIAPVLQPDNRTVEVIPRAATLSMAGERMVALEVLERVDAGAPTRSAVLGPVRYTSSNLSIAEVSRKGVVTALAPGEAMIEASISRGSRTYTAAMTVTVTTIPLDEVAVAGNYELTAVILSSNPGGGTWSGFEGSRVTADLVLSGGGASGISGYFLNLVLTAPEPAPGFIRDTSVILAAGTARSQFDGYGGEQLTLKSNDGDPRGPFAMELWVAAKSSDSIRGTFGCCGQVGGHFEIRRK